MEEIIRKTFRPEIKSVNETEGLIDMLIPMSTSSIDRDGESIDPLGWRKSLPNFRKRPVLLSSHDYGDLRKQIGEFASIKVSEDGLFAKPKYYINEGNEEADWAFKLASKGMAAYSVGFIPKAWTDGDGDKEPKRTYTEQELLEISHVVVPSNRDAIQSLRGKSTDPMINQLVEDIVNAEIVDMTPITSFDDLSLLVTKPEETDDYIRIPVDRGNHEGHRIRTIDISTKEGIKALYCGECKKVMTYLFAKDKGWTMEKAQAWIKEHEGKSLIQEHKTSQGEIADELDFVTILIQENGMNDSTKAIAWNLVKEIWHLAGNEMPDDIVALITKPQVKQITDDEKIRLIIAQTIKNIVKNS